MRGPQRAGRRSRQRLRATDFAISLLPDGCRIRQCVTTANTNQSSRNRTSHHVAGPSQLCYQEACAVRLLWVMRSGSVFLGFATSFFMECDGSASRRRGRASDFAHPKPSRLSRSFLKPSCQLISKEREAFCSQQMDASGLHGHPVIELGHCIPQKELSMSNSGIWCNLSITLPKISKGM